MEKKPESIFINRELSWLDFDSRVLALAKEKTVPLGERIKFAAIFGSNMDEFFMVRVGSLYDQTLLKTNKTDNVTHMTAAEQINAITPRVAELQAKCDKYFQHLVTALAQEGYRQYEISNFACPGHEGRHNLLYWNCKDYWGIGPAAHSCLGSVRRFWPNDTAAFIAGTVQEQYEGPCNAEDYLIMQLRLCSGLNLTEYAARYGVRFDAGQMAFLRHCAASGYAVLDGDTLRLTPSGMIVQNAILEELI